MSRPLVKVCGITREEDLEAAIALGADLVGLNFHPPSPRYLQPERAARLAARARGRVAVVGVFVDRPHAEVEAIDAAVGLDLLQLHGFEGPDEIARFGGRAVQVIRLAPDERPAPAALAAAFAGHPAAWGFVVDVRHPSLAGGTGESWRWDALAGAKTGGRPLLVAGGIRPDNAAAALAASGGTGIDVCSGVESAPGVKDRLLLEDLFRAVRSARAGYDGADADDPRSPSPRTPARGRAAPTDLPEDPDGEDRAP